MYAVEVDNSIYYAMCPLFQLPTPASQMKSVEWTLFLCVVITPSANILLPHDCLRCMYVVIRYLYVCSDCLRCLYVVIRYLYVSLACLYNS